MYIYIYIYIDVAVYRHTHMYVYIYIYLHTLPDVDGYKNSISKTHSILTAIFEDLVDINFQEPIWI